MELTIQRTVFDLESFDEVTLVKKINFEEVSNPQQALERLGGDSARLLAVINLGLRAETQKQMASDNSIEWFAEDESGTAVPFTGKVADQKSVNNLQLTLAKTVFGYSKDQTPEEKRAAKEQAMEMIRTTPKIKEGLQKSAAA